MHGPAMSGWLLVALCTAAGSYCLLRRRGCSGEERRAAGAEALMGFGMAAMAVPASVLAPPDWVRIVYVTVFGAAALRALAAAAQGGGHHLHHLTGSLAMVYMAVAMTGPGGAGGAHTGHGAGAVASGVPLVTGGLLVYYTVYVLRAGTRLAPAGPAPGGGPPPSGAVRPELTLVCRLSMGLAMVAMLVTL